MIPFQNDNMQNGNTIKHAFSMIALNKFEYFNESFCLEPLNCITMKAKDFKNQYQSKFVSVQIILLIISKKKIGKSSSKSSGKSEYLFNC